MKVPRFLLTTCILSICSLVVHAQQLRYMTKELTINRNGDLLTAIDASGRYVANVDLTKPTFKGKVIAFAYSNKKKEITNEVTEPETSLTLFPNPASKEVKLQLKGRWIYPVDVKIVDKSGNRLHTAQLKSAEQPLNVESLPQGVYILKAESGESRAVEKLVVE